MKTLWMAVALLMGGLSFADSFEDEIRQNFKFQVCDRAPSECRNACYGRGSFAWIPNDEVNCEFEEAFNRVGCYCAKGPSDQSSSEFLETAL
jgi:hypothetical protein